MNDGDRRLDERIAEAYRRPAPLDPASRARLDRVLEALPPPRVKRRGVLASLFKPRTLQLRPAYALAAVALVLAVGVLLGRAWVPAPSAVPGGPPLRRAPEGARLVEFVLVAPRASSVSLVGDFNGWDPRATPMRRVHAASGADSWTVAVPVSEGLHAYAFVVDDAEWIADPVAPLAPGEGFGFRSSVLVVGRSDS